MARKVTASDWKRDQKYKEDDRLFKANMFFSRPRNSFLVSMILGFILLFLLNFLANILARILRGYGSKSLSASCLLIHPRYWALYLIGAVVVLIMSLVNVYRYWNAYRDMDKGQKGTSRFTTFQEIREQYQAVPEIPEKNPDGTVKRIPGNGGLPVASKDHMEYLDESATNTLIIAITRAGKGEVFSLRMLDSYTRSEKQPSLVILDMKFDLRKMCSQTFQDRGYKVMSINLEQPLRGVGYNPLYLITRYYQQGKDSDAELLCKSFAYPHFASSSGKSDDNTDFFLSNATNALTALIMAHTQDCIAQERRINAKAADEYIQKRINFENLNEEEKEDARKIYREHLNEPFSERVENVDYIPDNVKFEEDDYALRHNNMASVINMFTNLSSQPADSGKDKTMLDQYFEMRGRFDRARTVYSSIGVSGDRTKGSINSQMLTKLSQYTFGGVEQLTRESSFAPEDLGFGKQPVALFLQVPFYDRSKDAIAISIIDQIYQANARACVQSLSGKCSRRVIFHLDEIAQFPPIENLDSKLSICLGLNMVFNLIIQTDAQLTLKYGEAAKIIKGNCGNQVFLQTSEDETAEMFSKLLGSRTIIGANRSGRRFDLDKSYTETIEERRLLYPRELMDLEEGENVILRTMYRRDLNGNKVIPRPIFNSEKEGRAYLYRYQYLQDYFPDAESVSEESLHLPTIQSVPADQMMYDYNISFEAVEFRSLRDQISNVMQQIRQTQRQENGKNKEEIDQKVKALRDTNTQLRTEYTKLLMKWMYQWDVTLRLPMEKPAWEMETAITDKIDKMADFDPEIKSKVAAGITGGDLMIRIAENPAMPIDKKADLRSLLASYLQWKTAMPIMQ